MNVLFNLDKCQDLIVEFLDLESYLYILLYLLLLMINL